MKTKLNYKIIFTEISIITMKKINSNPQAILFLMIKPMKFFIHNSTKNINILSTKETWEARISLTVMLP